MRSSRPSLSKSKKAASRPATPRSLRRNSPVRASSSNAPSPPLPPLPPLSCYTAAPVSSKVAANALRHPAVADTAIANPPAHPSPSVVVQRVLGAVEGRHEQIEEPVVVVVADRDRAGAPRDREPARRRDVLEAALAEVVEEPGAPVRADDHEICPAVAIEVAER